MTSRATRRLERNPSYLGGEIQTFDVFQKLNLKPKTCFLLPHDPDRKEVRLTPVAKDEGPLEPILVCLSLPFFFGADPRR